MRGTHAKKKKKKGVLCVGISFNEISNNCTVTNQKKVKKWSSNDKFDQKLV
jgi:hypothetical protein